MQLSSKQFLQTYWTVQKARSFHRLPSSVATSSPRQYTIHLLTAWASIKYFPVALNFNKNQKGSHSRTIDTHTQSCKSFEEKLVNKSSEPHQLVPPFDVCHRIVDLQRNLLAKFKCNLPVKSSPCHNSESLARFKSGSKISTRVAV